MDIFKLTLLKPHDYTFLPLTLIADMTGILGGMVVAKLSLFVDTSFFWQQAIDSLGVKDFEASIFY